jgi:rhamnose utilization protein RhaD (predicted bifunctional aldolase and dehydrogenase)/NAD(P)-dependent dehydrogenase (short-subunit alcohol dehydrogenase family)
MDMELRYLQDLWNEADIAGMDEAEILRYRSNLLGSDKRLTNFGGGNTSSKVTETDPITGEQVTVLWVKGSGGDLGTMKRDGLASLYMDKLNALKSRYKGVHEEDAMPALFPHGTFNNNPRAASIDTPLHGFIPFPHVDHLHPDWAIALAACANGPELLGQIEAETGLKLAWLPWKRPGFELGLWLENTVRDTPGLDGIILGSHGIFTWGNTQYESYRKTIEVIDAIGQFIIKRVEAKGNQLFGGQKYSRRQDALELAAEVMPVIRGEVGNVIGNFDSSHDVMRFVNSERAQALAYQGTSCPDHFVRTKVRPLYVEWDAENGDASALIAAVKAAFPAYREDYTRYYEENKQADSPALRSPNPTVVLVPGVGMFSFGRSKAEARITGEFYTNAIHVMEGATACGNGTNDTNTEQLEPFIAQFTPDAQHPTAVDNYVALPLSEAFGIEYWLLEEAKLKRMPPEKPLSRKVAVVLGASPGIGRSIAEKLAREGAHIVAADIKPELAEETAEAVRQAFGKETAIAETVDATNRDSVRQMLDSVTRQFGGVDILVSVAAVFFPPDSSGRITEDQWRKTFDVNLLASYVAADEAAQIMKAQGSEGSIVLVSSANGVVPKKGSFAYDTSKAAVNHLIRELAIEYAPNIRVNGVAPASVVEGSLQFPRDRVLSSLAKYNIAFDESESTEELRGKLAGFYAERTLLKKKVTPTDIAEATYLLVSPSLHNTTGQTLAVDAGLPEAFLR